MNQGFQNYNKLIADSFNELLRRDELVSKKTANLLKILQNRDITTVLHYGYGPTAIGLAQAGFKVTLTDNADVPEQDRELFQPMTVNGRYDATVALDEYFTFADTEEQQQDIINDAFDITRRVLITSVSDYKNMSENNREFGDPQSYKTQNGLVAYLERHLHTSRNSWQTKVHKILPNNDCVTSELFGRRTLFFKQLARMSSDAGATNFTFEKSMMFKGMLSKGYQHIITITF